jgi:hypothetical protein
MKIIGNSSVEETLCPFFVAGVHFGELFTTRMATRGGIFREHPVDFKRNQLGDGLFFGLS